MISVCPPTSVTPRASQAVCDLLVDGDSESLRRALGQEHRREEPPRRGAHAGDVVGVDLHGVPADAVRGEGDGVGLGDEKPVAHLDDGGVGADAGALQHARVGLRRAGQQPGEHVRGELAYVHIASNEDRVSKSATQL